MKVEMRGRVPSFTAGALVMTVILAGCGLGGRTASADPSATATASVAASVSPSESATPVVTASPVSVAPSPTVTASSTQPPASLPPFACETPAFSAAGAVDQAVITDVRVGLHADYDRIVFEFGQGRAGGPAGIPAYTLQLAEPPLTQTPSDLPMTVPGSVFLELVLQGGTKLDEDFQLVYDGATRFDPLYPALTALYEAGDFEAVSTWYVGLVEPPCLRVMTLESPPRLVIDLEH